jgi:hypothetical protein
VALTIDVVVDAARILDLLGDVVDEERLCMPPPSRFSGSAGKIAGSSLSPSTQA